MIALIIIRRVSESCPSAIEASHAFISPETRPEPNPRDKVAPRSTPVSHEGQSSRGPRQSPTTSLPSSSSLHTAPATVRPRVCAAETLYTLRLRLETSRTTFFTASHPRPISTTPDGRSHFATTKQHCFDCAALYHLSMTTLTTPIGSTNSNDRMHFDQSKL